MVSVHPTALDIVETAFCPIAMQVYDVASPSSCVDGVEEIPEVVEASIM